MLGASKRPLLYNIDIEVRFINASIGIVYTVVDQC
jgi:hypothetical protein